VSDLERVRGEIRRGIGGDLWCQLRDLIEAGDVRGGIELLVADRTHQRAEGLRMAKAILTELHMNESCCDATHGIEPVRTAYAARRLSQARGLVNELADALEAGEQGGDRDADN
jgi:hypothetical protein